MDHWNEVRTAYAVARLGTVSAAAEELNLHRATVIRHIDNLEQSLGTPLFQRHARGYTPTEAGLDLQRVAKATDEQLKDFAGRSRGRTTEVRGEIIVTSVEIVSPLVMRAVARFRQAHPETSVRYVVSGRVLQLAYGEAHVAIRAGKKPEHPDNVVAPYFELRSSLYAHARYIERYGQPKSIEDFADHFFVLHEEIQRNVAFKWLASQVPPEQLVLRSSNLRALAESVLAGVGIGFMPDLLARDIDGLERILGGQREWSVPMWLVTHVDLHRTAKVQAFLGFLKEACADADFA